MYMRKAIIMGAAGRDFHNFNVYFKHNPLYRIIAFTATQISGIADRRYPAELSGWQYPSGIPIYPEADLADIIKKRQIDEVVFSYSDVSHEEVMHKASIVTSLGANFILLGVQWTMIKSINPVISICAVRTGCGKSQTTRKVCEILNDMGKRVAVVRHPMPYGDLKKQIVQRFATREDIRTHQCTIEEREEYEPHIEAGNVVYAGVDYEKILESAEDESDVIVWDGGNNDTPFFKPDVHIVLFDPHRVGHELKYHPGEANLLMADIAIINKVGTAHPHEVDIARQNIERHNPKAAVVLAESPVTVENPHLISGKRVLIIEDGPTITHGGMSDGAGGVAVTQDYEALPYIVDPRPYLTDGLRSVYAKYPHIGLVLPAMGYGEDQIQDLQETINRADCDVVLSATPIDLSKIIKVNKPIVRVRYEYGDHGKPTLADALTGLLKEKGF